MAECSCNASTGICGCTTYGTGYLDDNGFWEIPCPHHSEVHTCMDDEVKIREVLTKLGGRSLQDWFDSMGPDEADLNATIMTLFAKVGVTTAKEVLVQETSPFLVEDTIPTERGWVAVADNADASRVELWLNGEWKARWAFASMGSWAAWGDTADRHWRCKQHDPTWKED